MIDTVLCFLPIYKDPLGDIFVSVFAAVNFTSFAQIFAPSELLIR